MKALSPRRVREYLADAREALGGNLDLEPPIALRRIILLCRYVAQLEKELAVKHGGPR